MKCVFETLETAIFLLWKNICFTRRFVSCFWITLFYVRTGAQLPWLLHNISKLQSCELIRTNYNNEFTPSFFLWDLSIFLVFGKVFFYCCVSFSIFFLVIMCKTSDWWFLIASLEYPLFLFYKGILLRYISITWFIYGIYHK